MMKQILVCRSNNPSPQQYSFIFLDTKNLKSKKDKSSDGKSTSDDNFKLISAGGERILKWGSSKLDPNSGLNVHICIEYMKILLTVLFS